MADKQKNSFLKRVLSEAAIAFLPQKGEGKKERIFTVIFSCTLIFAIVFTTAFYIYFAEEDKSRERNAQLSDIIRRNDSGDYSSEFKELKKINSDIKYGIKVNAADVVLPIVVSKDDYYCNHNYDNRRTRYGALYSPPTKSGKNMVVYGNDMSDGTMFGSLSELRNPAVFSENPFIELVKGKKSELYVIFSVMILAEDEKDDNGKSFDVTKGEFKSFVDYTVWVEEALSRSLINTEVRPQRGDKMLCLITDNDAFSGAKLAVMAFRINSGTNISHTDEASVNIEARYPKIWYEKNGYDYPDYY